MSVLLGVPKIRGNSDIINNYSFSEASANDVQAGVAAYLNSDGGVKKLTTSKMILGVFGYKGAGKEVAVIESGKGVGVKVLSTSSTSLVGKRVYVDPTTFLFTDTPTTLPTNAIFTSDKQAGVNMSDSSLNTTDSATIDFVGGICIMDITSYGTAALAGIKTWLGIS
jgi:hypothetical protein